MPAFPLLSIQDLSVDFITEAGNYPALRNISLEVNRGETLAIVGESGSGKSVTALSVLQLLPTPPAQYRQGKIWFSPDGKNRTDLQGLSGRQLMGIRGHQIAMIFQEPMTSLNPVFTCGEQVMETIIRHKGINTAAARRRTTELFSQVKLPDPPAMLNRYPHQLSGGQQQRVMIAMAMSCDPSLLIADEPTTALDVTVQKEILQLLRNLQKDSGMGVIFITHDLGIVKETASRIAVLYKGRIVEYGTAEQIFTQPEHPYTRALLACRPALYPKGTRLPIVQDFMDKAGYKPGASGEDPGKTIVSRHTGKGNTSLVYSQENSRARAGSMPEEPKLQASGNPVFSNMPTLVRAEQLSVWFPAKKTFFGRIGAFTKAVNGVTFEIKKGETLGLVGESGCGKSTLGRALLRLIEPTAGKIFFKDKELTGCSPSVLRTMRRDMQLIFQDPYSSLNPSLTVGEAILEPIRVHRIFSQEKQRRARVMELLEKVSLLPEHFNRYPHEFSGGQRQRIVIARALALNPSFIICDESVSALDVSVQAQVLNLLNDLKKEFGFTAIFISHDLSVVRYISDRIMVMKAGSIVETGMAEEIYANPSTAYTRALIEAIPGPSKSFR